MDNLSESSVTFKVGFVAVVGSPNVGKSTLINSLLKQKIAAVSPRSQTTRKRQIGVLTLTDPPSQIILIDTPGFHQPRNALGEFMNQEAINTLDECDEILLVVDTSLPLQEEDRLLIDRINRYKHTKSCVVALNKKDLVDQTVLEGFESIFVSEYNFISIVPISATRGDNLDVLISFLLKELPTGQPYYPLDQLTDSYERDIAADLIRETGLKLLRDEIPHGIAIRIDQYIERNEHGVFIEATVFVEREAHKPIIIGQGGKMLKAIGTAARREIEAMSGRSVFLQLHVKVRPGWRNDASVLRRFGYQ